MKNSLNEYINETAEQVRLFLSLDRLSSNALIDEIKDEKKVEIKLSKLLHLLVDRLKFQSLNRSSDFDFVVCKLREKLGEDVPKNSSDFVQWAVNNHNHKRKKRDYDLFDDDNKLKCKNETQPQAQIDIRSLQQENMDYKNEIQKLYDKIYRNKYNYKSHINKLKQQQNNDNYIQELEEQIQNYQNENHSLKKKIKSLKSEIRNNQEIYQFERTNKDDESLISQLQCLDCNCFQDVNTIYSKHKKLHNKISSLSEENQLLRDDCEKVRQRLSSMKSKYQNLILTNTKLNQQNEEAKHDNVTLLNQVKKLEESEKTYQDIHQQITDLQNKYENIHNEIMQNKNNPSCNIQETANSYDLEELKRKFLALEHAVAKLQRTLSKRRKYLLSN